MKKFQHGFTMIELVIVIAIIGILSAMAMPKLIDMRGEAQQAAVDGVAGAIAASAAINYAACQAGKTVVAVDNCDDGGTLLQEGLPTSYVITAGAVSAGATASCTLTGLGSKTATFTIVGSATTC